MNGLGAAKDGGRSGGRSLVLLPPPPAVGYCLVGSAAISSSGQWRSWPGHYLAGHVTELFSATAFTCIRACAPPHAHTHVM